MINLSIEQVASACRAAGAADNQIAQITKFPTVERLLYGCDDPMLLNLAILSCAKAHGASDVYDALLIESHLDAIRYMLTSRGVERWPALEESILLAGNAEACVTYAANILKHRWVEAETIIERHGALYAWYMAHVRSAGVACATNILKRRWAEPEVHATKTTLKQLSAGYGGGPWTHLKRYSERIPLGSLSPSKASASDVAEVTAQLRAQMLEIRTATNAQMATGAPSQFRPEAALELAQAAMKANGIPGSVHLSEDRRKVVYSLSATRKIDITGEVKLEHDSNEEGSTNAT